MRKNPLLKKLVGFQKAPRARFLLLLDKRLSQEELILYELGVAITDWDETHTETYGSFEATNIDLADVLGWESDSSASRHKKSLIQKKLFIVREDLRIIPRAFESWKLRHTPPAKIEVEDANIEDKSANMQAEDANIEEKHLQNPKYSLVSSKDHLVSEEIPDEEMDRIIEYLDAKKDMNK